MDAKASIGDSVRICRQPAMDIRAHVSGAWRNGKVWEVPRYSGIAGADPYAARGYVGVGSLSWDTGVSADQFMAALFPSAGDLGDFQSGPSLLRGIFQLSGSEHHECGSCRHFLALENLGSKSTFILCLRGDVYLGTWKRVYPVYRTYRASCRHSHDVVGNFMGIAQTIPLCIAAFTSIAIFAGVL